MEKYRYSGVKILGSAKIDPFVLIGYPSQEYQSDALPTIIGNDPQIRSHTIIYAGNQIGDNFITGHGVLIREYNQIGNDVSIGSGTIIEHHCLIGNRVRIHSGAFIPEYSALHDDCWIGPNVVLTNAKYPRSKHVKDNLIGPVIHSHAIIGANSTILPGVQVGEGSLVGAGSVVTSDVPPFTVVVGNPAKLIKKITDIPDYAH
jgi:acetyltransferase-like isoleucine patch superfamily enzyme